MSEEAIMEKVISLCKRRGFVFPSSELYGGMGNIFDLGPLGVEMKNNIKALWWQDTVRTREDVFGLETAIIMHPKVWEASGHTQHFHDPLVDCKSCKKRFRSDHLDSDRCPNCNGELTEPRQFNLMFETYVGPVKEAAAKAYLRPETAQGIFVDFLQAATAARASLPFGLAQIGKSFRNEISPGNFIFRMREFEQMELEYFVKPEEANDSLIFWRDRRLSWYETIGISGEKLRLREHGQAELAHYAKQCFDIEYRFPFGWQELEGIANRGQYDLAQHSNYSKKNLQLFDPETNTHILPCCIESSAGVERTLLTLLTDAYTEEELNNEKRVVLKLHPKVAPIKCAIFPLVKKEKLPELAKKIYTSLSETYAVIYDERGSIGRRYRRMDEIGTPYALTVDFQTLKDNSVTLRLRDSTEQTRITIDVINNTISKNISANIA